MTNNTKFILTSIIVCLPFVAVVVLANLKPDPVSSVEEPVTRGEVILLKSHQPNVGSTTAEAYMDSLQSNDHTSLDIAR